MTESFVSRLISTGSMPIYFITCRDEKGRDSYAYIISTPEKIRLYEAARHGIFNLHDYGKIIASGFGKAPDAETKSILKEQYDIEDSQF